MSEIINEKELGKVSGGWQYANGSYVDYGNYIVYTVAPGDVLSGIGQRFAVPYQQIAQWNNIKNPDLIRIGQQLTMSRDKRTMRTAPPAAGLFSSSPVSAGN